MVFFPLPILYTYFFAGFFFSVLSVGFALLYAFFVHSQNDRIQCVWVSMDGFSLGVLVDDSYICSLAPDARTNSLCEK